VRRGLLCPCLSRRLSCTTHLHLNPTVPTMAIIRPSKRRKPNRVLDFVVKSHNLGFLFAHSKRNRIASRSPSVFSNNSFSCLATLRMNARCKTSVTNPFSGLFNCHNNELAAATATIFSFGSMLTFLPPLVQSAERQAFSHFMLACSTDCAFVIRIRFCRLNRRLLA